MKTPKAEKVATFTLGLDGSKLFILPSNVEMMQESDHGYCWIHFSKHGAIREIIKGQASLLSQRHFGHQNAFMPASGERYAYYFNEKQILYVKASGREGTVVMRSGNEYRVKVAAQIHLRNLIAREDIDVTPKPEKAKAQTKKGLEDAVPGLEDL